MRYQICDESSEVNQNEATCSDICIAARKRAEVREEVLAPDRRLAQCQICLKKYTAAASGDSHFCSVHCRNILWNSFVA